MSIYSEGMAAIASEQDRLIATVVLAGWRIVDTNPTQPVNRYRVNDPKGVCVGFRDTRYTAALLAERYLNEERLHGLLPP